MTAVGMKGGICTSKSVRRGIYDLKTATRGTDTLKTLLHVYNSPALAAMLHFQHFNAQEEVMFRLTDSKTTELLIYISKEACN